MSRLLPTILLFAGALIWLRSTTLAFTAPVTFAPTIIRHEASVDFPNTVVFHLELESDAPVTGAFLTYKLDGFSCLDVASRVPVTADSATNGAGRTVLDWTWVMSRSGNPPPGAHLWWQWTLIDDAGNEFTTPPQELTFRDDRFNWRTVSAEGIHLHWYRGDNVGPALLEAAVAGLAQLQNDMGIELQSDVQIFIYGNAEEMRQAVLYIQDWAGGVAFSDHNVILIGVPPHTVDDWGRSTVRHELAHLVVGQFARSCVGGRRPTWLEEGLAVYAEGEPQATVRDDIARGLRDNSFEPIRSLSGAFPAHDSAASMAYSQSYSIVNFLLDQYGQEQLQALLLALASGQGYDEALVNVYGFNVDGLEVAWRAHMGLPERPIPATPTAIIAAHVPTVAPLNVAQSLPTPPAAASPPPAAASPGNGLCALSLAPLFLLLILSRRPRPSTIHNSQFTIHN